MMRTGNENWREKCTALHTDRYEFNDWVLETVASVFLQLL